jgi:hypothetical protein
MGIVKQNDGQISWATGGNSMDDRIDDPEDQFGRRNVCPFPDDVPTLDDLKSSR